MSKKELVTKVFGGVAALGVFAGAWQAWERLGFGFESHLDVQNGFTMNNFFIKDGYYPSGSGMKDIVSALNVWHDQESSGVYTDLRIPLNNGNYRDLGVGVRVEDGKIIIINEYYEFDPKGGKG